MNLFFLIALSFVPAAAIAIYAIKQWQQRLKRMQSFVETTGQLVEYSYEGNRAPGMYNIAVSGNVPFTVLVGFKLELFGTTGFDHYGLVTSSHDIVLISTYFGRSPTKFLFLANCDKAALVVTSNPEDQLLLPQEVYPPHWWQRLGFYS